MIKIKPYYSSPFTNRTDERMEWCANNIGPETVKSYGTNHRRWTTFGLYQICLFKFKRKSDAFYFWLVWG